MERRSKFCLIGVMLDLKIEVSACRSPAYSGWARTTPFSRSFHYRLGRSVPLSEVDRFLLDSCLGKKPFAWESFVDRFLGLIVHVVKMSARRRSFQLSPHDEEDLVAEIFLKIVENDFAVLRRFNGDCSLAAYLTVIARRIAVRRMAARRPPRSIDDTDDDFSVRDTANPEQLLLDRDEIESMLESLDPEEAELVRMFYLEGFSYQQISHSTGITLNSIGPTLSRARAKMQAGNTES